MKRILCTILGVFLLSFSLDAQNVVKGIVLDGNSESPLQNVSVSVKRGSQSTITKADGSFELSGFSDGIYVLEITLKGFETQNFPLTFKGNPINLGTIYLFADLSIDQDLSIITITDDELNEDASAADNISGLLQATRDIYLRTAAFEFSGSFFRVRGLDSENGTVMINGIEMNKLFNGRPQWANWGGLNDVTRNQEFSNGLAPSNYTFGGILGSTNINTRASGQRPGTRISYASSNRSYVHRVMATYNSGILEDGWAFSISASRRDGVEGFNDGSFYNATSLFASIEKKINDKHSLNLTSIIAPNKRGKSSANTQEVYDLKGIKYNSYWGYQDGRKRNSRHKELVEPIIMLNHYWNVNETTSLNTNVAYQYGKLANSRLDFGGTDLDPSTGLPIGNGSNPDPTYYQKLPSFQALRFPNDPSRAATAAADFIEDGQINWNDMYSANIINANNGRNSTYVLYEDRVDDTQFTINSIVNSTINENITFNGSVSYRNLKSENFANMVDLLGGTGFLDVNPFQDNAEQAQNDILNPNRIIQEGDRFRYNYNIFSSVANAFAQAVFKYKKVDFYTSASYTYTSYQREGLYQNGRFADNSFGKGEKLNFSGIGFKAGATYKLTGRHLFDVNAAYITKAPTIRNTFTNSRENHDIVEGITEEKIMSFDASYILRSPILQGRLTGYFTQIQNANEISFFFADGIGDQGSEDGRFFVQEILQGVDKRHVGMELGLEAQVTPTIKLKGVASIGQHIYSNNPNIHLTSDEGPLLNEGTKSFLKNYKLSNGPQTAYSVGFEYRDPDYWWISSTFNFMSNAYIDVSPTQRSPNFYTDFDGLPFNDYDPAVARQLLQQEKIDDYMVVNLIGGKSWKINNTYISLFASITNLFNQQYRTGGYEQGRNANYRQLLADKSLDTPVFGNRYWYGRGTTYFLNLNLRF